MYIYKYIYYYVPYTRYNIADYDVPAREDPPRLV